MEEAATRRPEPQSFQAEILADQVLAGMRGVAFVEHEIDDFQHGIEAQLQLGSAGHIERQSAVADLALGAYQALRDGGIVGEEGAGDLAHAESAHGFQAQGDARVARDLRMAAHEDHAQLVVAKLLFQVGVVRRRGRRLGEFGHDRVGLLAEQAVAAHRVDGDIVGYAEEPCSGVFRDALVRPCLQRAQHGLLHGLFRQFQMGRAEQPREMRDHSARLVPEQVLQQHSGIGRCAYVPQTCLTSMVPPCSRVG
jgi:hypothetical protein